MHLGNQLSVKIEITLPSPSTSHDLLIKRAIFYDRVPTLKQQFGFASPKVVCETIRIFATSFYGSVLWKLDSEEHDKLVRSWNVAIKLIWGLPYQAHKRFVEQLTECPHLQSLLHSRFIGFAKALSLSEKLHIKVLYNLCLNDVQSQTGSNLNFLKKKYELNSEKLLYENQDKIGKSIVNELPNEESWKINVIEELTSMTQGECSTELTEDEITQILNFVTTS